MTLAIVARAVIRPMLRSGFSRNQIGEGGFAEARRAVEEKMFRGMISLLGGLKENFQIILDHFLADIFAPRSRPEGLVKVCLCFHCWVFFT